jgi:hypothetical protein
MAHALAVIAATVSTAAIGVMVYLNVLLVSLALRASRGSGPRKQTTPQGRHP